MSQRPRVISKLSTLDAAKGIYFIIAGLAIRQSLALFSHMPDQSITNRYVLWERLIIGIGFVITVLRFTHGISLLYGYEKEQVETSVLPSPRKIFHLSIFLSLLAIIFYLMADNITHVRTYIGCTSLMVLLDLSYICLSGIVRKPTVIWKRWSETIPGTAPRAALQWIISDVILFAICLFLFVDDLNRDQFANVHMVVLSVSFIAAAAVDYLINKEFYFGGKKDRRTQMIVFVCSPLQGGDLSISLTERITSNIRRAQWYCRELMHDAEGNPSLLIPFASHGFYTYFLHDDNAIERIIGQDCAISYLHACDAIYVYLPFKETHKWHIPLFGIKLLTRSVPDESYLSKGMRHELSEAKRIGLEICYRPQQDPQFPPGQAPIWSPLQFVSDNQQEAGQDTQIDKGLTANFDPNLIRKRVFVCSYLRGKNFEGLNNEELIKALQQNIRAALWYCYELATLQSKDGKEEIAPFAPQAFYPYFLDVLGEPGASSEKWKAWFNRSIDVLKVCDAVYFYVPNGLPDDDLLSEGMKTVKNLAESIGLEIQYKIAPTIPENWCPALPVFLDKKLSKPDSEASSSIHSPLGTEKEKTVIGQ